MAVKQRHAQLLFEVAYGGAEWWLGHVQPLGGAGEVLLLGNIDEVADQPKLGMHESNATQPV